MGALMCTNARPGNHSEGPGGGKGRRRVTRPLEGNMAGASKPVDVSTKRQRIALLARQSPEMGFTRLLAHLIDIDWLTGAFPSHSQRWCQWAWTDKTATTMRRTWRATFESLLDRAKSPAHTRLRRIAACISPRQDRRPKLGRSGSPPSRIKCSSGRSSWCWKRSTSRDFKDLLVRLRHGRSAHRATGRPLATDDGDSRRLDRGRGHSKILRYDPLRLQPP